MTKLLLEQGETVLSHEQSRAILWAAEFGLENDEHWPQRIGPRFREAAREAYTLIKRACNAASEPAGTTAPQITDSARLEWLLSHADPECELNSITYSVGDRETIDRLMADERDKDA